MGSKLNHSSEPFDDGERLEMEWYEAVARRRAIIRKLQLALGSDLALDPSSGVLPNLVQLHEDLLSSAVELTRIRTAWEVARSRQRVASEDAPLLGRYAV